ncbi:MAG: hypothetical protein RSE00_05450 [Clostridia bacterium]
MVSTKDVIYRKACTEAWYIIYNMKLELLQKIPKEVKTAIYNNRDKEYIFTIDKTLPIYKQDLLLSTKGIISIIWSNYLCSKEEKEKWIEYDKFYIEKQNEINKGQGDTKKLFKECENKENSISIVEDSKKDKQNIFKKIMDYIKKHINH